MKKGEQQKILHKGSNDKVNAFITLLYPLNGIKFTTSKTRNSNDFINHLNSIKRYVLQRTIKRFILVIDNASFHISALLHNSFKQSIFILFYLSDSYALKQVVQRCF
jgi:DDE superfamily endonuclease